MRFVCSRAACAPLLRQGYGRLGSAFAVWREPVIGRVVDVQPLMVQTDGMAFVLDICV